MKPTDDEVQQIRTRFEKIEWTLDERMRRLFAAAEASALGRGGITKVSLATGVSRRAIYTGLAELEAGQLSVEGQEKRIRKAGAGRKTIIETESGILVALEQLIEPTTRSDPESPLKWSCKSLRTLAAELSGLGFKVSYPKVGDLLKQLGYSLQANRKMSEGADHPDRNSQFAFINIAATQCMAAGEPLISVDTKKKELSEACQNMGTSRRPAEEPEFVKLHDFIDKEPGAANLYGVDDAANNTEWVSVGTDHDTGSFAIETIRRWWNTMGKPRYPKASKLMITPYCSGSYGCHARLWKWQLQQLANAINLPIEVSHLPPGTSKWHKIEHRFFSNIRMTWRGQPLISHEVTINLIAGITTNNELNVHAKLDDSLYPADLKVSDAEYEKISITRHPFHGDWNYRIDPDTF